MRDAYKRTLLIPASDDSWETLITYQSGQQDQLHRVPRLEISMVTNVIKPRPCWTGHELFDPLCFLPFRGTEQCVSRCNNAMRFVDPRQDAGESFGFQEESEVEALLNRVSTSCAYFSDFDKPCDCNQRIAAAGQFRSSLLSHANRPSTF